MKKIVLEWKGEKYVIPENRVFEAVDDMENHVTLGSIAQDAQALRMGRLARAFSVLLEHAGAPDCSPQEVRAWMSASVSKMLRNASATGKPPSQEEAQEAFFGGVVTALSEILMDGAPEDEEAEPPKKKPASRKGPSK